MIIGGKYFRRKTKMNDHDKIIANIKASMSFEGLEPSEYVVGLLKQYSDGEITKDEVICKIKEKHNIKGDKQ